MTGEPHEPRWAIVNLDDQADSADWAALAAHYAGKLADHEGVPLADLDAVLDQIDADDR